MWGPQKSSLDVNSFLRALKIEESGIPWFSFHNANRVVDWEQLWQQKEDSFISTYAAINTC